MIDLVLEEFGDRALGIQGVNASTQILITHFDSVGALDTDQEMRYREAIVPDEKVFCADLDDLGIDECPSAVLYSTGTLIKRSGETVRGVGFEYRPSAA